LATVLTCREFFHRFIQREQFRRPLGSKRDRFVERDRPFSVPALGGVALASVLHHDLPHVLGGHCCEMRAAVPLRMVLLHQLDVRFVETSTVVCRVGDARSPRKKRLAIRRSSS
jgi:hypothetical protein